MPRPIYLALVVAAAITLIGLLAALALYLPTVYRIVNQRRREKPLRQIKNSYVSQSSLKLLTHGFEDDEDTVFWADRQHSIVFIPGVIFLALLTALFLILALWLARVGVITFSIPRHNKVPQRQVHLGFLHWLAILPLIMALATSVVSWSLWLKWRMLVRVITNLNLRVDIQPWPWAFWLWNDEIHDPQPLHRIERVENKATTLGRIFGYGTLRVITLFQQGQDPITHELHFIRNYEWVTAHIQRQSNEAKKQRGQESPEVAGVGETLEAIHGELRRQRLSFSQRRGGRSG